MDSEMKDTALDTGDGSEMKDTAIKVENDLRDT